MNREEFESLLETLDDNSLETLKSKNARYSSNNDCLHNFIEGSDISGLTPAQTCWGYLTKHLVALKDKIEKNDFSDTDDFLEKCQDSINYIRFLWCIGNEENNKQKSKADKSDNWFIEFCDSISTYDNFKRFRYKTKDEALDMLAKMNDIIDRYSKILLTDFYQLHAYTLPLDNYGFLDLAFRFDYGWDDLKNVTIETAIDKNRNKYFYLNLPAARKIN